MDNRAHEMAQIRGINVTVIVIVCGEEIVAQLESVYVPILTCGHKLWGVAKGM